MLLRYGGLSVSEIWPLSGRVERISRGAIRPDEWGSLIGNTQAAEPYYRVIVGLDQQAMTAYGKAESLKPGLLLEADILGERCSLVGRVFEPLYSLKGRL